MAETVDRKSLLNQLSIYMTELDPESQTPRTPYQGARQAVALFDSAEEAEFAPSQTP